LLAQRLRDTDEALVATNFLSVKGRVARALLSIAEAFGHDVGQGRVVIRQKVSQGDLAAMACVARENVSRVLSDWTSRSPVTRWRAITAWRTGPLSDAKRKSKGGPRLRSSDWLKMKKPACAAVKREEEEDWGKGRWRPRRPER
jgi:Crp-like helix-turn-helix domain